MTFQPLLATRFGRAAKDLTRLCRGGGRRCLSSASSPKGEQAVAKGHAAEAAPSSSSGVGSGYGLALAGLAAAGLGYVAWHGGLLGAPSSEASDIHHLVNWSGTHEVETKRFFQPETLQELEEAVAKANEEGKKIRPVGSALSPNGLSFCEEGMISMALLDKVLDVDTASGRVRVQAGARVQDVVEALRPHGLTLQNYASIREQQIGGFTQVGAHGTGAAIPPVDEQVVAMKVVGHKTASRTVLCLEEEGVAAGSREMIVTPGKGTMELSESSNPELFRLARCGLGALGVVAELTLQCIPAHRLVETTWVSSMAEIRKNHQRLLRENQHIRYMWIPYTDTVVVVANNRTDRKGGWLPSWLGASSATPKVTPSTASEEEKLAAMRALLEVLLQTSGQAANHVNVPTSGGVGTVQEQGRMAADQPQASTVAQLRDELVAIRPLEADWIARVNQAEAEYWKLNCGTREGWSDEMLGFDCGGQQWVLEMAFPTGTLERPTFADLAYMEQLLKQLEVSKIPAPSPIEQRWTSSSSSPMSPAFSKDPKAVYSWVGIIMYLPAGDVQQRELITASFRDYTRMVYTYLVPQYGAVEHWAKIEVPADPDGRERFRNRIKARYPVADFNAARRVLDPKNIMANHIVEQLFPITAQ